MSGRILIIEDDEATGSYLAKALSEAGYAAQVAKTGPDGLFHAIDSLFDVIILDRMLPGLDGLSVLRAIRAANVPVPVIILSALGSTDERVKGLIEGSDDYLTKPFAFSELLARIEAVRRRHSATIAQPDVRLTCGDLNMDLLARRVSRGGDPITLQPREFKLLEFLLRHKNQSVTRTMLLESVWDFHFDPQTNVIDVHISRLRQKIDRDHDQSLLKTVRGSGYMLSDSP